MDIRRSDLGLLVALDCLLEERSVTRAAERLAISQPAMSAQLARLRDLFDDQLLVPSGRTMVPTTKALEIQEPLHRLLDELGQLVRERQVFDPKKATNTFHIVATDYMHSSVTVPLMRHAQVEAPHIRIAMLTFDPQTAWTMIEGGKADILIVARPTAPPEAKTRKLYNERFTYIQRRGHPRGTGRLTLKQFCEQKHVLVSPIGGRFSGPVDDKLGELGKQREVFTSVPSFLLAATLVAQSDLVSVLPKRLADRLGEDVERFPLPLDAGSFDVLAAWHARRQHDPAHIWLRDTTLAAAYS